jgi:hypothetical protein
VSVSLASIVSLSCGATEFSPASLFTSGVQGAWYDPSDVLLNWRTNLLTYSQEFDNVAWTSSSTSVTISANTATAPDSTSTADSITAVAGLAFHYSRRGSSDTLTGTYTYSIYVKKNTSTWIFFTVNDSAVNYFNLDTGAFGTTPDTCTVVALSNGWYRISATRTLAAAAGNCGVGVANSNNGGSFTATGTESVYVWGAQLELGSTATTYQAITTPEQTYLLYDPQPVLFQDSAGTTPVTAVEQPVGLMLDKSQGATLGSEATSGSWLNAHSTTFDTFTSTGPTGFTATTTGAKAPRVAVLASLPTAGWYWIEFTATFTGGSFSTVGVSNTGSPYSAAVATTVLPATGVAFKTLIYTSAAREYLTITFTASGASTLSVTGVSVKSLAGNHASQATTASRPVLRARYNLLTYSEQFDNAAWLKSPGGVGLAPVVTANYGTAPDGTTTADRVQFNLNGATSINGNDFSLLNQAYTSVVGGTYTFSVWLKSIAGPVKILYYNNANQAGVEWNVTTDWQRFTFTGPAHNNTGANVLFGLRTGDGSQYFEMSTGYPNTADVLVWGAQFIPGSSAGTYQRIAAATDYATAGFLPYLDLITDDSFATNSIDFTTTDEMSVCAGMTKSAEVFGILAELSNNISNNGSFSLYEDAATVLSFASRGTTSQFAFASGYPAPTTAVMTGISNISGDQTTLRVNAVQVANNTGDLGTGNFGNYPLYIGRRGGTTNPFNGRIYSLLVVGKTLSASELAATESYVATKTGVTL